MTIRLTGLRHAVIVAPHPDDEIIGAAALIQALKRQRTGVTVVVVSDGGASHTASRRWPRERLIRARQRESRAALRRLGVMTADVTFLGLPDSRLPEHGSQCRRALRRIASRRGIDLIVGPAASDSHPDHRAVATALATIPGGMRRLAYRVWPPSRRGSGNAGTIVMRGGHAAKRSLIRMHRTQMGIITDDPAGFAIARHELDAFSDPRETFMDARR